MPFTLSHPAIVIPLQRLRAPLCMSALIIGSVTPDFEYFLKMKLSGRFGHTLSGAFILDLPLACLLLILFHQFVKYSVIPNLPHYFQVRFTHIINFNLYSYLIKHPIALLISLLTGIFSHLIWDSFTHANSLLTDNSALLQLPIRFAGFHFPVFRLLQHVSTLVGAIAILYAVHTMPNQQIRRERVSIVFWFIIFIVACVIFTIRAFFGFEYFGDIVASVLSAGFFSVILVSIGYKVKNG
jgi:hypothetical protein